VIDAITITNFLGVRHCATALSSAVLVCGPNAAGKTSLLDAIRFGLTGDLRRVALKKEARAIVSEGAKAGSVELSFTNESTLRRVLPSGDTTGEPAAPFQGPPLPLVLDAAGFAALSPSERRKMLGGLTGGDDVDREWVGDRLAQAGIPLKVIEQTLPLLRSGFEAAHTAASTRTTEARGAWRGITGEVYGSNKAETWTAERVAQVHDAEAIDRERAEVDAALTAARDRLSRARAAAKLGNVPSEEAVAEQEAKQAEAEARLAALRDEHRVAVDASAAAGGGTHCPCPECGAALLIDRGTLRKYVAVAPAEATTAKTTAAELARKIVDAEKWIGDLRGKIAAARAARVAAAAFADDDAKDAQTEAAAAATVEDLQTRSTELRTLLSTANEAARTNREAGEREQKAKEAHQAVGHWDAVAKLLSPDGLPAERLARTLAPFRDLLTDAPEGWPAITFGDDAEIRIGGRPYGLCSESERWRADVVCTFAIATLAQIPLVLIDRLDVLEPAARGGALAWLAQQGAAGTQVIAAATLKSPPNIAGIQTLWLGEAPEAGAQAAAA
jgi:hypothetical protein